MYDPITQLPDRELFMDRLQQAAAFAHRHLSRFALMCVSIHGFAGVAEAHGSKVAENYLKEIVRRIRVALRDGDTVARLLDQEKLALILNDMPDLLSCEPTIDRLLAAIEQPVDLEGLVLPVSIKAGVTVYPQDQDHPTEILLKQAEHALRQAQQSATNHIEYYPLRG